MPDDTIVELYIAEAWSNELYEKQIVRRDANILEKQGDDPDSLDYVVLNLLREAETFLDAYEDFSHLPEGEIPALSHDKVELVKRIVCLTAQLKKHIKFETKGKNERHSFDVEYKVREHVKAILNQLIEVMGENEYRIESERQIKIFDQEDKSHRKDEQQNCRPDFEIMLKNDNQSMLIVEVKSRLDKKLMPKIIERKQIMQHLK